MQKLKQVFPDISRGLSQEEAARRLAEYGENAFEEKKSFSVGKLLVGQFTSPLIYVLIAAGLVSLALHEYLDAGVILAVVLANTLLGFWQEFKAAKSLEALKSYLKPEVTVWRGGEKVKILMSELVPGDVCELTTGMGIPADGVLVEGEAMVVNEALLTGESRAVYKKPAKALREYERGELPTPTEKGAEMVVYMGTTVREGLGKMVVVATGVRTQMGKIADRLMKVDEEKTPLQARISRLARSLVAIILVGVGLIFTIGWIRGESLLSMFETAVALAVSAIPEGIVVSMTVILALGMQRILARKALVRKLVAAETLGSVSVICCDKTGTLTQGKMTLVDVLGKKDEVIQAVVLANNERDEEELAMMAWARKEMKRQGWGRGKIKSVEELREEYPRQDTLPFSSKVKYAASLHGGRGGQKLLVMGAPEVVMKMCQLSSQAKEKEMAKLAEWASRGRRIIGLASKKVKNRHRVVVGDLDRMDWVGAVAFEDPLREGVAESIRTAMGAGVKVKVITGDYRETAVAVMRQVFEGQELDGEGVVVGGEEIAELSEKELQERVKKVVLFARTTPDQKLEIVKALKANGEVVAMTGDGVNDAPALKAADIGIVVNEATDVSKETADMVLLESNFGTIVEAIREGRVIFDTMRKVVAYLLSDVFQGMVLVGGSLAVGLPVPVSAVQILWINLVEDSFIGMALAFDATDEGVMKRKPMSRSEGIIDREVRWLLGLVGVASNLVLLGLYGWLLRRGLALEELRTMMFVSMATNSLFYVFSFKSLVRNVWQEKILDNKFLIAAVGLGLALTLAAVYVPGLRNVLGTVPLVTRDWLVVGVVGLIPVGLVELVKLVNIRLSRKEVE